MADRSLFASGTARPTHELAVPINTEAKMAEQKKFEICKASSENWCDMYHGRMAKGIFVVSAPTPNPKKPETFDQGNPMKGVRGRAYDEKLFVVEIGKASAALSEAAAVVTGWPDSARRSLLLADIERSLRHCPLSGSMKKDRRAMAQVLAELRKLARKTMEETGSEGRAASASASTSTSASASASASASTSTSTSTSAGAGASAVGHDRDHLMFKSLQLWIKKRATRNGIASAAPAQSPERRSPRRRVQPRRWPASPTTPKTSATFRNAVNKMTKAVATEYTENRKSSRS